MRERDIENGQISSARLEELLKDFRGDILTGVDERLTSIQIGLGVSEDSDEVGQTFLNVSDEPIIKVPFYVDGKFPVFMYAEEGGNDQKYWQVPKDFVFPKVNRFEGWKFWLLGMPQYHEKIAEGTHRAHPIMPFRYFDAKLIPKKAKNSLRVSWQPVFQIMDGAIPEGTDLNEMTSDFVDSTFDEATKLLRSRASYCFRDSKHQLWNVSTWSKKVSYSQILKFAKKFI